MSRVSIVVQKHGVEMWSHFFDVGTGTQMTHTRNVIESHREGWHSDQDLHSLSIVDSLVADTMMWHGLGNGLFMLPRKCIKLKNRRPHFFFLLLHSMHTCTLTKQATDLELVSTDSWQKHPKGWIPRYSRLLVSECVCVCVHITILPTEMNGISHTPWTTSPHYYYATHQMSSLVRKLL